MTLDTPRAPRVAAVLLALVLPVAGCTGAEPGAESRPTSPATSSAPLAAYDTDGLKVARRDPCAGISDEQVADALGAAAEDTHAWAPGDNLPGGAQVADEFGCRHRAGDVTVAAWVFAPPVSGREARDMVAETTTGGSCSADRDSATFGAPGLAYTCQPASHGPAVSKSSAGKRFTGLVGDSWVVCELRGSTDTDRVGRWCVAVLDSLSES